MPKARPAAPGATRSARSRPSEWPDQEARQRSVLLFRSHKHWLSQLVASCALHGLLIAAFVWLSPAPPVSSTDPIQIDVMTAQLDASADATVDRPERDSASVEANPVASPDPAPSETPLPETRVSEPAPDAPAQSPPHAQSDQQRAEAALPPPASASASASESPAPDAQAMAPPDKMVPEAAMSPPMDHPPASADGAREPPASAPRIAPKPAPPPRKPPQANPQPTPASTGAAAAPIADKTGERTGAPPQQASDISPRWRSALAAWLHARKSYPHEARTRGDQGGAAVRFTVTRDGQVVAVELVRGSGSPILDQAVRAMLDGARVPAFPPDMAHERITVTVQINYNLDR